ncbi:MAG: hypothetical protein II748_01480 [Clostridia bacterium]|nr:hypothetical protein [Clostridia bacterium]
MDQKYHFSLLWPDWKSGRRREIETIRGKGTHFNQEFLERDINVETLLDGMQVRNESKGYVKARLTDMVTDENVIKYRQDVLKDFMKYPDIEDAFDHDILPHVTQLHKMETTNISHDDNIRKIAWRIDMLRIYSECVDILRGVFCTEGRHFESEGIKRLIEMLNGIIKEPGYQELIRLLPDMLEKINTCSGVTIGVNLDSRLQPQEAVLLTIEPKPFKNRGLVTTLFGNKRNDEKYFGMGAFYSILKETTAGALDQAIMRDLSRVMKDTFNHLGESLAKFEWIETAFLTDLLPEAYYYIGGARLAHNLTKSGMPVCFPEAAPMDERIFRIKDIYDASFALKVISDTQINKLDRIIVTNDVEMSNEAGHIFILTGANQGGKTTFTRAIGIAQLLYQAGFPVPGRSGRISPVDNILTHFPELEKNSISEGRLGEECIRLEAILPRLTKYSMLLMNESLSSTSHQECLTISEEIMRYLRTVGVRTVFATHMHELAEEIPELNKEPGLSNMVSLVAGVDESADMEVMTEDGIKRYSGSKRTYRIVPMPPQGKSFALDIARTYGISYNQLLDSREKIKDVIKAEEEENRIADDDPYWGTKLTTN